MAVHNDNPAGRLLTLLRQAKSYHNTVSINAWAQVFNLPFGNWQEQYELIHRLWEVNGLIDNLEQEIRSLEDDEDKDSFLQPIERFRNAVPIGGAWGTNVEQTLGPITDGDLIVLDFCSRALHRLKPEPVADQKELGQLKNDVDNLFEKVHSSTTLETDLKKILLVQIETIRRGIQEYRIGGLERLRETLGSVLGTAMVNQEKMASEAEEVKQFIEVTSKLISIIEFAWKTTALLTAASSVLPRLLTGHD